MTDLKVSVVTVSHNSVINGQLDPNLILSLFAQSRSDDFEIVIVDNGSCDETGAILQELSVKFNRLKILSLSEGCSIEEAFFVAAKNSSAPYLWFLDLDELEHLRDLDLYLKELEGFDCLRGVRKQRRGVARTFFSVLMNYLFWLLSGVKVRDMGSNFYLMSRGTCRYLLQKWEEDKNIFVPLHLYSDNIRLIEVGVESKAIGRSSYSTLGLVRRAISLLRGGLKYRLR